MVFRTFIDIFNSLISPSITLFLTIPEYLLESLKLAGIWLKEFSLAKNTLLFSLYSFFVYLVNIETKFVEFLINSFS